MKTLQEIPLSEHDRRAIQAAAYLLRERFPVEQVVLFGSRARGDHSEESDIDLLVLTSRRLTRDEKCCIVDVLYPLQLQEDVVFSTLELPKDEWEDGVYQVLPLRLEIERDGVLV